MEDEANSLTLIYLISDRADFFKTFTEKIINIVYSEKWMLRFIRHIKFITFIYYFIYISIVMNASMFSTQVSK